MFGFFRRLMLGLVLIAAASALLLFSDLGSRAGRTAATAGTPAPAARQVRIAYLQHASQGILDDGRRGMLRGLAERGWEQGRNLTFKAFNAEGDVAVAQSIAKEMASGGYDLLLTSTTVSLQAVANANRAGKTPHVFALVSDPYGAGVGINRDNHLDHPAHLAGYGTMQPVALAFRTARECNPALRRVGVLWNPAEGNSLAQVKVARTVCAELGIELLETSVDSSAAAAEAAGALVARGIEALWLGGDVTVLTAVDAVIAVVRKARIPAFSVIPPNVRRGSLFDVGADYTEIGRQAGLMAGEVLNGRQPATVSIDNLDADMIFVNRQALAKLKPGWSVPEALAARAALVIDPQGREQARAAAVTSAGAVKPEKTHRIALASFAPDPIVDLCQQGLLEGLKELGIAEGLNLTVTRTHAQGEFVNILPMLQNLDASATDAIVAFTTPVLQGTFTAAKHKPVVFTCVTDPLAAGAGRTFAEHLPHVTGIGSLPPVADAIRAMRRLLPHVRKVGTLYNSGEANSVKIISLLREATRAAGLELVELTAASTNEVVPAMQALVARRVDAVYVPSDNTAYLAFDGLAKVALDAKLPLIVEDAPLVDRGGLLACGPGFYQSGRAAAAPLARVLRGESPAGIPMANVSVNEVRIGRQTAQRLGLSLDEALLRELESSGSAPAPGKVVGAPANPNPTGKKWKIAYVIYNSTPPGEETLAGMQAAWARSALVAGRDYEIKVRNAQGDIALLAGIIDAALTDGADIIVPLSTPALQLAVQKVKRLPVVFGLVANPMAVGAGRSYTDHLPNVTGVAVLAPFGEAFDLLQRHFPTYRTLGTLFCPAEANSVDLLRSMEAECRKRGLTLVSVAANTSADLPDASLALAARPIDAVLQLSDNLSSAGFPAIVRAARQAKKPLFSLNSTAVNMGAAVSLGRDYHNGGEATVALIERVIRGEDPGRMPFELPPKVMKAANPANAAVFGLSLPPALLQEVGAK